MAQRGSPRRGRCSSLATRRLAHPWAEALLPPASQGELLDNRGRHVFGLVFQARHLWFLALLGAACRPKLVPACAQGLPALGLNGVVSLRGSLLRRERGGQGSTGPKSERPVAQTLGGIGVTRAWMSTAGCASKSRQTPPGHLGSSAGGDARGVKGRFPIRPAWSWRPGEHTRDLPR